MKQENKNYCVVTRIYSGGRTTCQLKIVSDKHKEVFRGSYRGVECDTWYDYFDNESDARTFILSM